MIYKSDIFIEKIFSSLFANSVQYALYINLFSFNGLLGRTNLFVFIIPPNTIKPGLRRESARTNSEYNKCEWVFMSVLHIW